MSTIEISSPASAEASARPDRWSSETGFMLAAAGSAIGLGNIWKFPYIVGENGGGAFVLVYLAAIVLIGGPILLAEMANGRAGGANPYAGVEKLRRAAGAGPLWRIGGALPLFIGPVVLAFYSVVGGWTLAYAAAAASNGAALLERPEATFAALLADPAGALAMQGLFLAATGLIVAGGVRGGVERMSGAVMPILFLLVAALAVYAAFASNAFGEAAGFVFTPRFSALTAHGVLEAIGHAFFTLSVGAGIVQAYAARLGGAPKLARNAAAVVGMDTAISLMAAMVVFSFALSAGVTPDAGPGLIFITLPAAFAALPFGAFVALAFFALVAIAALTSAVSLMEPATQFVEERFGAPRAAAAFIVLAPAAVLGVAAGLSFNVWSDVSILGRTIFDALDAATSNIALPLCALFACLIATRLTPAARLGAETGLSGRPLALLRFLLGVVAPAAIVIVMAAALL